MILSGLGLYLTIFKKIMKIMILAPNLVMIDREESASPPSPSPRGSAPSDEKLMFPKMNKDHSGDVQGPIGML